MPTDKTADTPPTVESAFFDAFFTNAPEGIFITDTKGFVTAANVAYCEKVGVSAGDAVGKPPPVIKLDAPVVTTAVGNNFYAHLLKVLERSGFWKGGVALRRADGSICAEWLSFGILKDGEGRAVGYVGTIIDTNEQGQSEPHALNKHCYDQLTKLPNRLLLQDRLEFMINVARRNSKMMALILLDIDRFKLINETFGYEAGDALLKTVAETLTTCIRDVDAVFRSGDDEFALILEEIAHPGDASKVAERILQSCCGAQNINSSEIHVSVCVGISTYPTDGSNNSTILQCAEAAMHRARERGFANYMHYKPNHNTRVIERLTLENDLRQALDQDELFLLYQPQVEMKTNRIIGTEALIRWRHPRLGIISPNRFIPIAEDTGLIIPIGDWVLQSACMQARKWQSSEHPIILSVNLAASQFNLKNIVQTIEDALTNSGMSPDLLEIEITESMCMRNPEETLRTLGNIKDLGVSIAIDDFGTGYSSLSYLRRFPIDTLKIDRSFLIDIPNSTRDTEIVKAIISMAHSLNLTVTAEGVEREAQQKHLIENNCEKMQGYLFSPPVPTFEFERLLLRQMR